MTLQKEKTIIGWAEWVQLPLLHLPYIKAKVDTGARTSALHAFSVESFAKKGAPWVKFEMHPLHGHADLIVTCEAPVIDRRMITDSGGKGEKRLVIETFATVGDVTRSIEITLTNREKMAYRMLLGRQALERFGFLVDPKHTTLLTKLRTSQMRKAYANRHIAKKS
jgi:hypothetical protein